MVEDGPSRRVGRSPRPRWSPEPRRGSVDDTLADLRASALQAARRRRNIAWLFAQELRRTESVRELAQRLGCLPSAVYRLALCDRPRPRHVGDDVAAMAAYLGLDADRLAAVLHEAEAHAGTPMEEADAGDP